MFPLTNDRSYRNSSEGLVIDVHTIVIVIILKPDSSTSVLAKVNGKRKREIGLLYAGAEDIGKRGKQTVKILPDDVKKVNMNVNLALKLTLNMIISAVLWQGIQLKVWPIYRVYFVEYRVSHG